MTTIPLTDDMQAPATRAVIAALEAKGGAGCVRFVGGCVRNALMQRPGSDLDLSTQLLPDDTEAALAAAGIKSVPTGKAFGTITALVDGVPFEITSLREDVETDGRRAVVKYTDDWTKDARRRDFYLNALYADGDGTVYDPTGQGIADAQSGCVRFIGEASERIREDYLRILRFFRFSAGYAEAFDDISLAACVEWQAGIDGLSGERIQQEIIKTLALANPLPAFEAMQANGLMLRLVPGWKGSDLTVLAAMCVITGEIEARFLGLLDCGVDVHDLSAVQARLKLSGRLRMRLQDAGRVSDLLAEEVPLARLIYRHGRDAVIDAVRLAAAHRDKPRTAVDLVLHMISELTVPSFPLKGADLIAHGIPAGPEVGVQLKKIETEWLNHDFSQSVIDEAIDALAK